MHLITSRTLATRRDVLRKLALAGAFFTQPGLYAEALGLTPRMTEGPYYPANTPFNNIPLDKDNDLVLLDGDLTPANGTVTHLAGRVLDPQGRPVRGALVEIWHADHFGEYIHSTSAVRNPRADKHFAGFGQCLTGADGAYRFRTIKAGLYRGRTRHVHAAVTLPGAKVRTTTQLFWDETPVDLEGRVWSTTNENDNVLSGLRSAGDRASVVKTFEKVAGSAAGEERAMWDLVMGSPMMQPEHPGSGTDGLVIRGVAVPGGRKDRWKVTVPAVAGYSYEVYANPENGRLGWAALPFALTPAGAVDRNITTADREGALDLYVERASVRGSYLVGWRPPGANLGTPTSGGGGPRSGRPPGGGGGSQEVLDLLFSPF